MGSSSNPGGRRSRTYLLRIWREHTTAPWRAALRSAGDDDVRGFADLEDLLAFLQRELEAGPAAQDPGAPGAAHT